MHIEFDIDSEELSKPLCEIINCKISPVGSPHIRQVNLDIQREKEKKEDNRKYFCNNPDCKKEIDKTVVAWCLHPSRKDRFDGKVYCKDCQEKY